MVTKNKVLQTDEKTSTPSKSSLVKQDTNLLLEKSKSLLKITNRILTFKNKRVLIKTPIIVDEVVTWMANPEKTQKLCGYEWIIEQAKSFIF